MRRFRHSSRSGLTLVELVIAASSVMTLGMVVWVVQQSALTLFTKNISINVSHSAVRTVVDRLNAELVQADSMPELIDSAGTKITTSPAAGIMFDRFKGGPYVVARVSSTGLPSTTTVISAKCAVNPSTGTPIVPVEPPLPVAGDVLRFDGAGTTLRPQVQSATANRSTSPQVMTITLKSSLGTALVFADTESSANLVSRVAFLVRPAGGKNELRYYSSFEGLTNLDDKTRYTVLTSDIGTQTADATPFSIVTKDGKEFVVVGMGAQSRSYDQALAKRQQRDFNTFVRLDTIIRPRAE